MMTIEEKLKMYREKKNFIHDVSMAFIKNPKGHSVDGVVYEVWFTETERGTFFNEWVIVQFAGGAESHRIVTGNSSSANFREVARLIEGGYYEERASYEAQAERGFKKLCLTKVSGYYEEV